MTRPRVTASRISIVAFSPPQTIAMNLLHGDHTAVSTGLGNFTVAILESHEVGSPCTILAKGRACCSYSFRTIDVLGESGRAEWKICGEDVLMISKNPVTKRKQSLTRSRVGDAWIQSW